MSGQIDATAEGELVVDYDDLLVVGPADRNAIVEPEPDASRRPPTKLPSRERVALQRVERGVVPDEDVAAQVRASACDEASSSSSCVGASDAVGARQEIDSRKDVPTQDEDSVTRPSKASLTSRKWSAAS